MKQYAYGLPIKNLSRTYPLTTGGAFALKDKYQYNQKELNNDLNLLVNEARYRTLDPQLGNPPALCVPTQQSKLFRKEHYLHLIQKKMCPYHSMRYLPIFQNRPIMILASKTAQKQLLITMA